MAGDAAGAAAPVPIPVTEAESEILAALWRFGPLSGPRLVEAVKTRRPWGEATIKTLLHRLMQKAAVASEQTDGRRLYRPLLTREAYVRGEGQALADRLFHGDLAEVTALLAEAGKEG